MYVNQGKWFWLMKTDLKKKIYGTAVVLSIMMKQKIRDD